MREVERQLRAAVAWARERAQAPEVVALLKRAKRLEFSGRRECLTSELNDESGYIDVTLTSKRALCVTITHGPARIEWFAYVPRDVLQPTAEAAS